MDNKLIQQQVDKAFQSLDNIQRAYPNPFFFTRLQARIEKTETSLWEKITRTLARPVIAGLSILTIVAINTVVVVNQTSESKAVPEHAEMAIADEYNRTIAYYAIENVQP